MENVKRMPRLNVVTAEDSAAFGGCVVQREAREVQRVKIMNKVSYAEALKKVRGAGTSGVAQRIAVQSDSNTPENQAQTQAPVPTQSACDHRCKVNDDTLAVNKVNFVVFICQVPSPEDIECIIVEICSPRKEGNIKLINLYNPCRNLTVDMFKEIAGMLYRKKYGVEILMHTVAYGAAITQTVMGI